MTWYDPEETHEYVVLLVGAIVGGIMLGLSIVWLLA